MRLQKPHVSPSLDDLKFSLVYKWKKDKGLKILYGMCAKREEGQK